jgi:FkbM family methyltransferase
MIVVQIGANRGYDELTDLIKNIKVDKLVLVEPMSKFNDSLLKCYNHIENLFIENVAITDDVNKKKEYFYLHEKMDDNVEQASLLKSHINKVFNRPEYLIDKSYDDQLLEVEIECSTINNLFDKYNLTDINILFIDAEGLDDRIIKSVDFSRFNIEKIYYENMHIDNFEISNFLNKMGYLVTDGTSHTPNNSIAIKTF